MSHTTMHVFDKDGKATRHLEYGNSWGYAMPCWNYLADKYLRRPGENDIDLNVRWFIQGKGEPIWELMKDPRLEHWERIILGATLDRVFVKREHFADLATCFRKFDAETRKKHPNAVCHYAAMAQDLEQLPADTTAVAWNATSVTETYWWKYDDCECPEDAECEHEEGRPYDMNKDQGHWSLYDDQAIRQEAEVP